MTWCRRRRWVACTLILVMAVATLTAARAEAASDASQASQTLGQCLQLSPKLSVVVLMDESGSLAGPNGTDPANRRIDGLKAALSGLSRLTEGQPGQAGPSVEVLLVGFSTDAVPLGGWQPLSSKSLSRMYAAAATFAPRNHGTDTDYGTALTYARNSLVQRSAAVTKSGGAPPCKALVWFTDGKYDIVDRPSGDNHTLSYAPGVRLDRAGGGSRAVAAGREFICKRGGLADDMVRDGIVTLTVALSTNLEPTDRAFLQALTIGQSDNSRCGTLLTPATGEFLDVRDASRLFFAFGGILDGAAAPIQQVPVCPGRPCTAGRTTIRTIPGIRRFVIRAVTGSEDVDVHLVPPRGPTVVLRAGVDDSAQVAGASITARWASAQALEITADLTSSDPSWVGPWAITYVRPSGTPATGLLSVLFSADMDVTVNPTRLLIGQSTPVEIHAVSGNGAPLDAPRLLDQAAVTLTLSAGQGTPSADLPATGSLAAGGSVTTGVELASTYSDTSATLDVRVAFGAPTGVPVVPVSRAFRLAAELPADQGFPKVEPGEIHLPSIEGTGATTADLTVTASPSTGGCVRLGAFGVDAPPGAQGIAVAVTPNNATSATCLRLAPGKSQTIGLRFAPRHSSTGRATVRIPVIVSSELVQGERTIAIEATTELTPTPDVAKRLSIVALLTILGLVVPLGLIHAFNVIGAKFIKAHRLRSTLTPVVVDTRAMTVQTPVGEPVAAPYEGSSSVSPANDRRFAIGPFDFRTVASVSFRDRVWRLLRGSCGVVDAVGGPLLGGNPYPPLPRFGRGGRYEAPLALPGTWLFRPQRIDQSAGRDAYFEATDTAPRTFVVQGDLLLLITDGGSIDQGSELLAAATGALLDQDWTNVGHAGTGRAPVEGEHGYPEPGGQNLPDDPVIRPADGGAIPPNPEPPPTIDDELNY